MAKIVVIGSLNIDMVAFAPRLPRAGETIIGTQYSSSAGGKGANQAYAAARLGGDVAMLGRVGTDDHGNRLCDSLKAAGCDVDALQAVEGPSGAALIFVAANGENSIVVIPGANHRYLPIDLQADAKYIAGAQIVLLQLETPMDTVVVAARASKHEGSMVILDPAPIANSLPLELLRSIDIITPNEIEATQLIRGCSSAPLSVQEALDVARHVRAMGVKTVILKLGAQGCLLMDGEAATRVPAPPVIAVDTTAAGDVFNAALAVACSEGALLADACRFAVHAAALSVTRLGAQQNMPNRAEVMSFYHSTSTLQ